MITDRSQKQQAAFFTFLKKAQELPGKNVAEDVSAMAKDGLLALAAHEGWSVASSAIEAVSNYNPSAGFAAAANNVAVEILSKSNLPEWKTASDKIGKGEANAAVIGLDTRRPLPVLKNNKLKGETGALILAPIADYLILPITTDGKTKLLLVGKDRLKGAVGKALKTGGLTKLPSAAIKVSKIVPSTDEIDNAPEASDKDMALLRAKWRLCVAATLCGIVGAGLREIVSFASSHKVGEKPVFKFQTQSFRAAEIYAWADTAKLMLDRAAYALDSNNGEAPTLCDCAQLAADDAVEFLIEKGARVMGATGAGAGSTFKKVVEDASTARFCGAHPDAIIGSIYEAVSAKI